MRSLNDFKNIKYTPKKKMTFYIIYYEENNILSF